MQDAYSIFILLSLIGILLGIVFFYIYVKQKSKDPYFLISAIFMFLIPALTITGMVLNSENLAGSAFLFPTGLFIIATIIDLCIRQKKCTFTVPATCISFETRGRGRYYAPQFSYKFNGKEILAYSFTAYSKRMFKKNFEINGTCDIFIHPQKPTDCVGKKRFCAGYAFALLFGILFSVIGLLLATSGIVLLLFF